MGLVAKEKKGSRVLNPQTPSTTAGYHTWVSTPSGQWIFTVPPWDRIVGTVCTMYLSTTCVSNVYLCIKLILV